MERIELERVAKIYGRNYALNRVTTTFRAGRLVVLLGPNGAGKSTLISLVATLAVPDRGRVLFDGTPHTELMRGDARGRFGYVSHDALLYLDLTGRENLAFYARLYGIERARERIGALLERVELTEAADRVVRGYSRGMRQRLSIARGAAPGARRAPAGRAVYGTRPMGRALALTRSSTSSAGRGASCSLSTHRLGLPSSLVDEVRILRRGRLLLDRELADDERLGAVYAAAFDEADAAAVETTPA